jgi:hypothetical protein
MALNDLKVQLRLLRRYNAKAEPTYQERNITRRTLS